MTTATKALITRTRNLIAQLASGEHDVTGRTELMVRINALTLKLDRAGEPALANELMAAKSAANAAGEKARAEAMTNAVQAARAAERDAKRADPCFWMYR